MAISLSSQHLAEPSQHHARLGTAATEFSQCYPQFAPFFHKLVNGNAHLFGERLLYFVHISTPLASLIWYFMIVLNKMYKRWYTNQMMLIVIYCMITSGRSSFILCLDNNLYFSDKIINPPQQHSFIIASFNTTWWTRLSECTGTTVPLIHTLLTAYNCFASSTDNDCVIGTERQILNLSVSRNNWCRPSGILASLFSVNLLHS